jgi:predicted small lipoprotein YifL
VKSRILTVMAVATALAACGDKKPYVPQVDMTGHTKGQYDYDLLTCQENARQQDIAPGVVLGATAGVAAGAIGGNAALGAMAGVAAGGAGTSAYDDIATSNGSNRMVIRIRECMAAKGYKLTGIDSQNADDPGPPKDYKAEPVDNVAPPPPGSEPARPPTTSQ